MRTSYSKLSVMVAFVALGTTACSSGPTSPTAPKFRIAAPAANEQDAGLAISSTPEHTGWTTGALGDKGRSMVYRSGYIISTGALGSGSQTLAPINETNETPEFDR